MALLQMSPRWKTIMSKSPKNNLHLIGSFDRRDFLPTLLIGCLAKPILVASLKKNQADLAILYAERIIYSLDFVKGQQAKSIPPYLLIGMCSTSVAISSRKKASTKSTFHEPSSLSIKHFTLAFAGIGNRG